MLEVNESKNQSTETNFPLPIYNAAQEMCKGQSENSRWDIR
jgi:hypothetical protein